MCEKSSATDGLPPITRASSPPSGRARRRLSRIMLFRSQESSRASSRLWSCVLDIIISVLCHHKRDGVCDSARWEICSKVTKEKRLNSRFTIWTLLQPRRPGPIVLAERGQGSMVDWTLEEVLCICGRLVDTRFWHCPRCGAGLECRLHLRSPFLGTSETASTTAKCLSAAGLGSVH